MNKSLNQEKRMSQESNGYQGNREDFDGHEQAVALYAEPKSISVFGDDPGTAMAQMQNVVKSVANHLQGENFISTIKGRKYPKVEWWTTVGASVGLFPVTKYSKRLDREDEIVYEARVEVMHGERLITAGEAICSSLERNWKGSDEYAIKSMAITRATGKAYRTGLSMIAVMAGLEGTPAEEMPTDGRSFKKKGSSDDKKDWLNEGTKHWANAESKVRSGDIEPEELRDFYKVSGANMEHFERLKQDRLSEMDAEVQEGTVEDYANANPDLPF